jgi:uncharacterized membrane protein YtjA (UPF0391 family)
LVKEIDMLRWSLGFFLVAIFAATFGFGGAARGAPEVARVLFYFFLVVSGVTLIYGLVTVRKPPVSIP